MESFSESLLPEQNCVKLIQEVSGVIVPDDIALLSWYKAFSCSQANRLASDLAIIQKYVSMNANLLEIGSIPLILTAALKQLGYTKLQGMDIDPSRFTSAIKRFSLKVQKCDIEKQSFPLDNDLFEAIIFNELFEHLRINPIVTFREIYRVLRTNGILLLSTPNLRSLKRIINFIIYNHTGPILKNPPGIYEEYIKLEEIQHMGHARVYTSQEVIQFLEKMGFHIEAIIYRGSFQGKIDSLLIKYFPSLKPFFTLIARKM